MYGSFLTIRRMAPCATTQNWQLFCPEMVTTIISLSALDMFEPSRSISASW